MSEKNKKSLYKEENPTKVPHKVVPSKGDPKDPNRKIYVCYGDVCWDKDGEYRKNFYLIPFRWGTANPNQNCHIPLEDINAVMEAIQELKKEQGIS